MVLNRQKMEDRELKIEKKTKKTLLVLMIILVGGAVLVLTNTLLKKPVKYLPKAEEETDRCLMTVEVAEDTPAPTIPIATPTTLTTPTLTTSCSVTRSGRIVSASGNGAIRLWLQKEDGTKIEGITFGTERTISGHYYYELANPADLGSLSSGNYYISCDADISSDHGCSGNPACSWERNLRPEDCSSFPQIQKSCSENDNLSFSFLPPD